MTTSDEVHGERVIQLVDPGKEYSVEAQFAQATVPEDGALVFAGQMVHDELPEDMAAVPAGHGVHDESAQAVPLISIIRKKAASSPTDKLESFVYFQRKT